MLDRWHRRRAERTGEKTLKDDAVAGVVLGVESVPDGLASGLLAGVNPLAGVYGYLYGTAGGAFFTGSPFMAVQATGAMALIVADAGLADLPDPSRALFTLSLLTGFFMVIAGLLRAGSLLRFVPTGVMVGFISAVGVNIVLGQLENFTGYTPAGDNRLTRTIGLILTFWKVDLASVAVGTTTLVLILILRNSRLKALGLVVAVVVGSAMAALLSRGGSGVALVGDLSEISSGLPLPTLPAFAEVPVLLVPALSLMFVGLVQGAAVSAAFPPADGSRVDPSKDFIGQGAGNLASGLFQGMPVGGSMSASALVVAGGAKTRAALVIASLTMAFVIVVLADVVALVAMPAIAALLIIVGIGSIKPGQIRSVYKAGPIQGVIMTVTFALTIVIPLQFAVLAGVGLAVILYVGSESNALTVRALVLDGPRIREADPPAMVPLGEVVVLAPYGSLFFASTPVFEGQLPTPNPEPGASVVILRLRGVDQLGLAMVDVLARYARDLGRAGSCLKVVAASPTLLEQLRTAGLEADLGEGNLYVGSEWLGDTLREAHADALEWIAAQGTTAP